MKRLFLLALSALFFGVVSGQENLSALYYKLQRGEAAEVIAQYSNILKDTSLATPELLQLLGDAYKIQYDYTRAMKCYTKILNKRADDKRALENAADISSLLGETGMAIIYLEKLMPLDSNNFRIKYKLASAYQAGSNLAPAINLFRQLLPEDRYNFNTLKALGDCYRNIGNLDSARYFFDFADNVNQKSLYTKIMLSRIYFDKEDFNTAKIFASRGLDYDSTSLQFRKQYANCCYKLQEYEEAFTHFNYLISKGDSSASMLRLAGVSLYFIQKFNDAIPFFKKCVENGEDNSQTMFYLGACLDRTGNFEEALKCLSAAYMLLQPDPEIMYIVKNQTGITLNNMKEYSAAYDAFQEAFDNKPEDYKLLFQMAMMKGQQKGTQNLKDARSLLQKFLKALEEKKEAVTAEDSRMKADAINYLDKIKEELFMSGN
jgi:tetratricopeptide (TPR) repeat protein